MNILVDAANIIPVFTRGIHRNGSTQSDRNTSSLFRYRYLPRPSHHSLRIDQHPSARGYGNRFERPAHLSKFHSDRVPRYEVSPRSSLDPRGGEAFRRRCCHDVSSVSKWVI